MTTAVNCRTKLFLGILTGLLLLTRTGQGQPFRYRADVEVVAQRGFCQITLPPPVLGHLNEQLSDIRLYDDRQREVPYLLRREKPVQYSTLFREYEVVSKVITPKVGTSLVLRNAAKSRINNISLVIKNANVRKKARLSGSNDAKTWFVIEEQYRLGAIDNGAQTTEAKLLNFPLSDYEYYQLVIDDSLSAPLNILRAGYYDGYAENGKYVEISGLTFTRRDSAASRQSYFRLSLKDTVRLDKLTVRVSAPAFYRRTASLAQRVVRQRKRGRQSWEYQSVSTVELSSSGENTGYLNGLRAKELYLTIDNEDNAPLTIGGIKAYQLSTYLVAELQPEKSYHLEFASRATNGPDAAPSYDLRYFQNKIPAGLATVQLKEITVTSPAAIASPTLFTNRKIIWLALGLVLVVLSYLSYRMLKEVGKDASKSPDAG